MGMQPLLLKPGVEVQKTPLLAGEEKLGEAAWVSSNLIRFDHNSGLLQKYGGWSQLMATPLIGTCRGMLSWDDFTATNYLVMGTEQRLTIYAYGATSDITPVYKTSNVASRRISSINLTIRTGISELKSVLRFFSRLICSRTNNTKRRRLRACLMARGLDDIIFWKAVITNPIALCALVVRPLRKIPAAS